MTVAAVLEARRAEIGISLAEISRRTGIKYDALFRAFKGQTQLKGEQFIKLCRELGLDIADFEKV